jgi:methylated-DNA-[protein]-cysteine S-methyltransferase
MVRRAGSHRTGQFKKPTLGSVSHRNAFTFDASRVPATVGRSEIKAFMFYDYFDTGVIGTLTLVGDHQGLHHIEFEKKKETRTLPSDWTHRPSFFNEAKAQLRGYFRGRLKTFDLALAPKGTPFQLNVWQALRSIPYGELASYGDIARAVGNPKAVRAVGGANAKNPLPIIVPCHRVIGRDGSLTGFGGGLEIKQRLIDLEHSTPPRRRLHG